MAESIDHDRAVRWLEGAGYIIRFRDQGWAECLVLRDRERWLGRGADEHGALADVVWQMLPSHGARILAAIEGVIIERPRDAGDEVVATAAEPALPAPSVEATPAAAPRDDPDGPSSIETTAASEPEAPRESPPSAADLDSRAPAPVAPGTERPAARTPDPPSMEAIPGAARTCEARKMVGNMAR